MYSLIVFEGLEDLERSDQQLQDNNHAEKKIQASNAFIQIRVALYR